MKRIALALVLLAAGCVPPRVDPLTPVYMASDAAAVVLDAQAGRIEAEARADGLARQAACPEGDTDCRLAAGRAAVDAARGKAAKHAALAAVQRQGVFARRAAEACRATPDADCAREVAAALSYYPKLQALTEAARK